MRRLGEKLTHGCLLFQNQGQDSMRLYTWEVLSKLMFVQSLYLWRVMLLVLEETRGTPTHQAHPSLPHTDQCGASFRQSLLHPTREECLPLARLNPSSVYLLQ